MVEAKIDFDSLAGLDKQIETLFDCVPLPEAQVKELADKVSAFDPYSALVYGP